MTKRRGPPLIRRGGVGSGLKEGRIAKNVINPLIWRRKLECSDVINNKFTTIRIAVERGVLSCQINIIRLYINPGDEQVIHTPHQAECRPADAAAKVQNAVPRRSRTGRRDHNRIQRRPEPAIGLEQAHGSIEDKNLFGHGGSFIGFTRQAEAEKPPCSAPALPLIHNPMTAAVKMTDTTAHPLDRLSALLGGDMVQVNGVILRNMESDVALIPQLAAYLIAAGGKRIRPLLTLACTRLYNDHSPRPYGLAASVEFIHTATLLHDDVVDESVERRGKASANVVFGNQASVLVGDFLFSRAFQLMVADGSLEVLRILSTASAVISEGEVLQLAAANNVATNMDDYNAIIAAKTAALFAAACEIGPVIAGAGDDAQRAMRDFGHNLGMAFQIADDILDYTADQAKLGKTVGDDFREGKLTAPVILALAEASDEERAFWTRTMAERKQTEADLAAAQAILTRHDAFNRGLALARGYAEKARQALMTAPAGDLRDALADVLAFSVDRAY